MIKRLFVLLFFCSSVWAGPAAHIAAPSHYSVLLDNEHVLVLKMKLLTGEQDVAHSHHNETVYFQQGGQLRIQPDDGDAFTVEPNYEFN